MEAANKICLAFILTVLKRILTGKDNGSRTYSTKLFKANIFSLLTITQAGASTINQKNYRLLKEQRNFAQKTIKKPQVKITDKFLALKSNWRVKDKFLPLKSDYTLIIFGFLQEHK